MKLPAKAKHKLFDYTVLVLRKEDDRAVCNLIDKSKDMMRSVLYPYWHNLKFEE